MAEDGLEERLGRLEQRLARIERLLSIRPDQVVAPPVVHAPVVKIEPAVLGIVEIARAVVEKGGMGSGTPGVLIETAHLAPPPSPPRHSPPPLPVMRPVPLAMESVPVMASIATPAKSRSLEQTLGLKWTGWVGALVLLVGAALGVRFVYQQHWFDEVPHWVWLSLIALTGFGLIGLGEWAFRKVHAVPGASLFGAGIATLFLASYVGYAYYKLYDPGVAFALMGISTVVGAAVARRGNLVSIGVLSFLGGNLTPIVLHTDHPSLVGFLAYLGMLQAVALILAFLGREQKWWALRGLAWAGSLFWMETIATGQAFGDLSAAILLRASVAYAAGFQFELVLSRLRGRLNKSGGAAAAFSIFVAAALTVGGLWILRDEPTADRVMFVGIEAAAALALAIFLRRGAEDLATSFAFQGAALLALLVPVALKGEAMILGWGILAMAMALMGRRREMLAARAMAPGVWGLAVFDLILRIADQSAGNRIHQTWLSLASTPIEAGLLIGWMLALSGEAIAWLTFANRTEGADAWRPAAWIVSVAAAGVWVGVSIQLLPPLGATGAILGLAWVLAILDCLTDRLKFAAQGIGLLLVAAVKIAAVDGVARRLSPEWSAMERRPLVNAFVGLAGLVAVSFPGIFVFRKKSLMQIVGQGAGRGGELAFGIACCAIGVLAVAFSLQIDLVIQQAAARGTAFPWPVGQMENLALTLLWSAAALAIWGAGVWTDGIGDLNFGRGRRLRWMGAVLVGKFIIADTAIWFGQRATAMPGMNLLIAAALAVAGVMVVMTMIEARPEFKVGRPALGAVTLALFTWAWAGSFEIDRAVSAGYFGGHWPRWQLTGMLITMVWAAGAMALYSVSPKLSEDPNQWMGYRNLAAGLLVLLGIKYLTLDTAFFLVMGGTARAWVVVNPQALTGAVLVAGMGLVWGNRGENPWRGRNVAGFLMMLILLWIGTLEIDRFFEHWSNFAARTDQELARQVAVSIFWGLFAVGAVAVGFRMRAAAMRYFGLGLFGVTLLKVVLVDLGQVSTGYRVLSFLGLGGLLMGTSILYGKLTPKEQKPDRITSGA